MVKFERHPAPEKLLRQMTVEAVNLLILGGPDKAQEAALPEAGVRLIVKAWDLPQEDLSGSLNLIHREKQLVWFTCVSEAAVTVSDGQATRIKRLSKRKAAVFISGWQNNLCKHYST